MLDTLWRGILCDRHDGPTRGWWLPHLPAGYPTLDPTPIMRFPPLTLVAAVTAVALSPSVSRLAQAPRPHVVSVDFVKARPGERSRLIRYYQLNWTRARVTVLARGEIVDFRMLVRADTGTRWDVALETTYADSSAYARAEAIFQPVLAAQGVTLVDGKRRADIADIVESRIVTVAPRAP